MVYLDGIPIKCAPSVPHSKINFMAELQKKKSKCKVAGKHNCLIPCLNNLGMFVA